MTAAATVTVSVPQGTVQIESGTNSNLVLDVDGSGKIIQWTRDKSRKTQSWRLVSISGAAGLFHIAQASDNTQVLVAVDLRTLSIQRLVSTNRAHQWAIRNVSGETYELENQLNHRAPSVVDVSTQPGARVILYDNSSAVNQRWRLVSSRGGSTGWGSVATLGGMAGGAPLCEWRAIPPTVGGSAHIPIIVELYRDRIARNWPLVKNVHARFTRSIDFADEKAPEYSQVRVLNNDTTTAAVVRPGPDFDPSFFYKVTLFDRFGYKGPSLPLTIGVYPDLIATVLRT